MISETNCDIWLEKAARADDGVIKHNLVRKLLGMISPCHVR